MFRSSLRSVAGPVRCHVCRSCLLACRVQGAVRWKRCYVDAPNSPSQPQSPPAPPESISLDGGKSSGGTNSTQQHAASKPKKPQKKSPAKQRRKVNGKQKVPRRPKNAGTRKATPQRKPNSVKKRRRRPVPRPKRVQQTPKSTPKPAAKPTPTPAPAQPAKGEISPNLIKEKLTGSVSSDQTSVTPLPIPRKEVPGLSYGLERVLFNPGVYHLRDPRSRVYNFDPYLGTIMPVTEFDFQCLKEYITSSKDEMLIDLARKQGKKYVGSSSSMTSVLAHFHYLLSAWRALNLDTLSRGFPEVLRSFTRLTRAPVAMFLHYKDGVYAIDADKEFETANILMNLGKSMEKLLTLPKEEFERYRRSNVNKITAEEEQANPEAYHYSTSGDFIMRSQLDAYDPRLPGTGMFDLKTRAVLSIRMDSRNAEKGMGYEIKGRFGEFESFEREYFDMIRAAFLKYSLQVRMGRMDGIFVAFHNIERIFGFQYVSLEEMDLALHGQEDTSLGDKEFELSLALWNQILNKVTERYPKQSLRFHFETRDTDDPFMYIFAEPVTLEEIEAIQNKNKEEIDRMQRKILNLDPRPEDDAEEEDSSAKELRSIGEEAEAKRLEAEILSGKTVGGQASSSSGATSSADGSDREVMALILRTRSSVNGRRTARPMKLTAEDKWTVDYELSELRGPQVHQLYEATKKRRAQALEFRGEDESDGATSAFIRRLRELARQGREYRKKQQQLDEEKGIVVLGDVK